MTVINGIEVGPIEYLENDIKQALKKNTVTEDKLHVIAVVSNPCLYQRRYELAKKFMERFETEETDCILYVVELAYGSQPFVVTETENRNHLQIRTDSSPLWAKENLMNIGVKKLLPPDWKAVCFCDADIEFDNPEWARQTLKILNGCRDIVQPWSHALDQDKEGENMNIFTSFGYQYSHGKKYKSKTFSHPGFSVCLTREAFLQMGGLYQLSILGSGDTNLLFSVVKCGLKSLNEGMSEGYKRSIEEFEKKCCGLRLGYIPGVIKHNFHGFKKDRGYSTRWKILVKHQYDPCVHVTYDQQGLMIPSGDCPGDLLKDILKYFSSRNEDG